MPTDELLRALRAMFCHRIDKIALRRRFKDRSWKKGESLSEYVHDKVILANRISLPDDEMLQYIIESIPDSNIRDAARIHGFSTKESLLQAFEAISLRDQSESTKTREKIDKSSAQKRFGESEARREDSRKSGDAISVDKRERMSTKHCFNCGASDHVNAKCPAKGLGRKCFKCGKHGHIASACSEKRVELKSTNVADVCVTSTKTAKRVSVNGHNINAIFDTASDISIVRADQYVKCGRPEIVKIEMAFKGVGNEKNKAMGFCDVRMEVDGSEYELRLYVVANHLFNHELLIGTDFLDEVRLIRERGVCVCEIILLPKNEECESISETLTIETVEEHGKEEIQISEVYESRETKKKFGVS